MLLNVDLGELPDEPDALYAYAHVARDAGYDMAEYPAVSRWLELVEAEPGFVNDLVPYPENARAGNSTSIYDG